MIESIRRQLVLFFGPLGWWPGDSPDQVAMGAILVQRTTWRQAAAALRNLADGGCICLADIESMDPESLADAIRPAGFFRQKGRYLRALAETVRMNGGDLVDWLSSGSFEHRRGELLDVTGIGRETADVILLYGAERPVFIVDAYARRIFRRHGIPLADQPYEDLRLRVEREVGRDPGKLGEFHAGLVETGKRFCLARRTCCDGCPLRDLLPASGAVMRT